MSAELFTWHPGSTPLLISVPHAGTYIPAELRAGMSAVAQGVPDTDWHIPLLYDFARGLGVGLLAATHSRYVVDLNRNVDGAALYPGASNTELCPTQTFALEDIYQPGCAPDAGEIAQRCTRYYQPFHQKLATELANIKARHGYALLLDAHSIHGEVPRFFEGELPHLNLGTADGTSCAPHLQQAAEAVLAGAEGFSHVSNGRFKGGTITRRYGQPAEGVHALQLEIAQRGYMSEAPPWAWNPVFAKPLQGVLAKLLETLLECAAGLAKR